MWQGEVYCMIKAPQCLVPRGVCMLLKLAPIYELEDKLVW